ncbi:MAG: hypothetical protein J0I25_04850 [Sphingomonadales bacterium]|nr:hypothetical protein [Sphingomonadales bacterium]
MRVTLRNMKKTPRYRSHSSRGARVKAGLRFIGVTILFAVLVKMLAVGLHNRRLEFPIRHVHLIATSDQPGFFALTVLVWLFIVALFGLIAFGLGRTLLDELRR